MHIKIKKSLHTAVTVYGVFAYMYRLFNELCNMNGVAVCFVYQ